jgi:hypothetical protein
MTTKLLRQVQEQDQQELADRYNGTDAKQSRRKWIADALKPELTEPEYAAAERARDETRDLWTGRDASVVVGFQIYPDPITGMLTSGKEQSELRKSNAAFALEALRQGVSKRSAFKEGPNCAEWIARGHTIQDAAIALNWTRSKGVGREHEPDLRRVKPFVRLVLMSMADYYADCDRGAKSWRGVDDGPEQRQI